MDKKFKKKLKRKEKRYYLRLQGEYKFQYSKVRSRKRTINLNKKALKSKKAANKEWLKKLGKSVELPDILDLDNENNFRKTGRACQAIHDSGDKVFIDTKSLKKVIASGGALLISSILRAIGSGVKITSNYPKDFKTEAVLQKIGYFQAIGKEERISEEVMNEFEDIGCWYIYKDTVADPELLQGIINEITSNEIFVDDNVTMISEESKEKLGVSIIELIANTAEHAYSQDYSGDRHWILFAKFERENNRLSLVISDSGKSIPITFVQYHKDSPSFMELIKKIRNNDYELIKKAIEYGSTGTARKGRGKGLSFVKQSIKEYGGYLFIFSGRGRYFNTRRHIDYDGKMNSKVKLTGTVVNMKLQIDALL